MKDSSYFRWISIDIDTTLFWEFCLWLFL